MLETSYYFFSIFHPWDKTKSNISLFKRINILIKKGTDSYADAELKEHDVDV